MKNTKKSLFFSITALILCCALLAGTTLAWFTDSVSSGVNTITAGNLDIELYHSNKSVTSEKVTSTTGALFKDVPLWEPGAYAYETFTVKNEGNLALKYQLKLNVVGKTTVGNADLADVLRVKQVPSVPGTRPSSTDPEWAGGDTLAGWSYNSGDEVLQKGASKEVTVVIYWIPGENDNKFNMNNANQGKALSLDVGVQLIATQATVEDDSFDNQYDAPAIYPALAPIVSETISYEAQVNELGELTQGINQSDMKIPAGTVLKDENSNNITGTTDGKLEREMKTVGGDSESVTVQINYKYKTNTSTTSVTSFSHVVENMTQLSTGLNITKVLHTKHDGTSKQLTALAAKPNPITDADNAHYYYEATTGKLYIYSRDYSPFQIFYTSDFVVSVNGQGYGSLEEAVGIAHTAPSDATVTLLKNVTLTKDLQLGSGQRGVNLNLNGKTIDGGEYQLYTAGDGTINIFGGGTIRNNNTTAGNSSVAALYIFTGNTTILDGVTLEGYYGVYANGNLKIQNAVINAVDCGIAANESAQVTIGSADTAGDIKVTASAGNCISTQAAAGNTDMNVTIYNGSFTSSGTDWRMCPIYWASHGTLNVYGGTFKNETSGTGAAGLLQKNGTVNVYGGSFAARDGIKLVAQSDSAEIVTAIQGGTFTGTRSGIYIDASNSTFMGRLTQYGVTIANNGEAAPQFIGGNEGAIYAKTGGLGSRTLMTLTGGTFSSDPSKYVGNDKFVVKNGNHYEVTGMPTGTTIPVYPGNIQDVLDGKYGSINDKTLVLSAGDYEKLELGRATKYPGSNTDYYIGSISQENKKTYDDFAAIKNSGTWSGSAYYVRNMSGVTLKAAEGATVKVAGMTGTSGHVYGNCYDYVLDKAYTSGSAYYLTQKWQNITIDGITFTAPVNISSSLDTTVIDGVIFENCTFNIGSIESGNQALRYYNENNDGRVSNLTVDSCRFQTCYQGVYTQKINGVTVTNSTFDTTGHNAIAVQSGSGAVDHKAVVITDNTFANIGDRIIRFGDVGADTQITIQNNTATNSGDSNGEVIKAQTLAAGVTYFIGGNSWGEGKTVANPQFKDPTT